MYHTIYLYKWKNICDAVSFCLGHEYFLSLSVINFQHTPFCHCRLLIFFFSFSAKENKSYCEYCVDFRCKASTFRLVYFVLIGSLTCCSHLMHHIHIPIWFLFLSTLTWSYKVFHFISTSTCMIGIFYIAFSFLQ